jgi:hypothetical protein
MRNLRRVFLALVVLSASSPVMAHEGHKHTTLGTAESVEKVRLAVKDADGKLVTFVLNEKTTYLRGETTVVAGSVKVGERVAVEFEESGTIKTALKVRVGVTEEKAQYSCPMHPEVVSDQPGKCPKCGMNLVAAQPKKP